LWTGSVGVVDWFASVRRQTRGRKSGKHFECKFMPTIYVHVSIVIQLRRL